MAAHYVPPRRVPLPVDMVAHGLEWPPPQCLLILPVWGPVLDFTWGTPEVVNHACLSNSQSNICEGLRDMHTEKSGTEKKHQGFRQVLLFFLNLLEVMHMKYTYLTLPVYFYTSSRHQLRTYCGQALC